MNLYNFLQTFQFQIEVIFILYNLNKRQDPWGGVQAYRVFHNKHPSIHSYSIGLFCLLSLCKEKSGLSLKKYPPRIPFFASKLFIIINTAIFLCYGIYILCILYVYLRYMSSKTFITFLSFEQKPIHLPSMYWMTHWLTIICPHNALKNLAKVEKAYTGLQGFRQQVTWPTLLGSGNNQDYLYLKSYMRIDVKNFQLF